MYEALSRGEAIWHGIFGNRFFPLAGYNLNLVALFSTAPLAFMLGNAITFILLALAFYALVRKLNALGVLR